MSYDYNTHDASYETCQGCPRRLTNGENCHTESYCPGWAYRERLKQERYKESQLTAAGIPPMSSYQKRLIYKIMYRKKRGYKE